MGILRASAGDFQEYGCPTDHPCTPKVHENGPARFGGQEIGPQSRCVTETDDGLVLSIFLI